MTVCFFFFFAFSFMLYKLNTQINYCFKTTIPGLCIFDLAFQTDTAAEKDSEDLTDRGNFLENVYNIISPVF